jgi:hypothetical protein
VTETALNDYMAALTRKLRLKPPLMALALNAPTEFCTALRAALGFDAVRESVDDSTYDVVSLFARFRAEVEASAPAAIAATRAGGQFWIMWPKKSAKEPSDLDRDTLWALVQPLGWGPVASIAIDNTWSALRFRPEGEIQRRQDK